MVSSWFGVVSSWFGVVSSWFGGGFILVWGWFHPGLGWFHPGLGWFHPGLGVVSSWFGGGFILVWGWFHPGLGVVSSWFGGGFILVWGWFHPGLGVVSSWFRGGFILVWRWFHPGLGVVSSWFWVFSYRSRHTDNCHPFRPATFICHPLTSRPTQDQGICNLANCNYKETLTQMGLPSSVLFPRLHKNRHPKNKEVHSCRSRPFAMQRTSTENIARVLGLDTKPQGGRNSSSHCRLPFLFRRRTPSKIAGHAAPSASTSSTTTVCTSSTGSGMGTASPPPAAPATGISAASSRLISKTPDL